MAKREISTRQCLTSGVSDVTNGLSRQQKENNSMSTISWKQAQRLASEGGTVEMRFSCSCGRTGHKAETPSDYTNGGWAGHYGNRPTVIGVIAREGDALRFPNGQLVNRSDFDWLGKGDDFEGESEDCDIELFSDDPDDPNCCFVEVTIVACNICDQKEILKDQYATVVHKMRKLGFSVDDWKEANNKADALTER